MFRSIPANLRPLLLGVLVLFIAFSATQHQAIAEDQAFYTPPANNDVHESVQNELDLERARVEAAMQAISDVGLFGYVQTGAASYTQTAGKRILCMSDTSAVGRTITLLTTEKAVVGRLVVVKDTSGAAGTNNITVTSQTGNIDGASTKTITSNYGTMRLFSDGTNWFTW